MKERKGEERVREKRTRSEKCSIKFRNLLFLDDSLPLGIFTLRAKFIATLVSKSRCWKTLLNRLVYSMEIKMITEVLSSN